MNPRYVITLFKFMILVMLLGVCDMTIVLILSFVTPMPIHSMIILRNVMYGFVLCELVMFVIIMIAYLRSED